MMRERKTYTGNDQVWAHPGNPACTGPRSGLGQRVRQTSVASPEALAEARKIDRLQELVVTPPLSALEACFASNWLSSARRLLSAGELGAARFQVAAVQRKLARCLSAEGLGDRAGSALSHESDGLSK
jgi:hypothetical protein